MSRYDPVVPEDDPSRSGSERRLMGQCLRTEGWVIPEHRRPEIVAMLLDDIRNAKKPRDKNRSIELLLRMEQNDMARERLRGELEAADKADALPTAEELLEALAEAKRRRGEPC